MVTIKKLGGLIFLMMGVQAAQAVEVSIVDPEHPNGKACTGFQRMVSGVGKIALTFGDNCVGVTSLSDGYPKAEDQTLSVVGGQSESLDVSKQAVVKLPLGLNPVQIVAQPSKGNVQPNGSSIFYTANPTTLATSDSFTYKIKDATGLYSNEAMVSVSIAAGSSGNGGGSTCTSGGGIVCKGSHGNITNGGQIQHIPVAAGSTHVWEFEYIDRASTETIFVFEATVWMDITINKNAGDMRDAAYPACKEQSMGIMITANSGFSEWACLLQPGETYFLNIRNLDSTSGKYGILR